MPKYEVAAHSRYNMSYHLVWIVKYRHVLLTKEIAQRLVQVLRDIGRSYELPVEEIGTDGDHLHLFCKSYPNIKPARVVEIFKSISAKTLMKEFPSLRKENYGAGLWGVGYYLATVGHGTFEQAVRHYVRNQGRSMKNYKQLSLFL